MAEIQSTPTRFVLPKTLEMVSAYYALGQKTEIRNIIDLGIFKGGSSALFHCLFHPHRLVAVDINTDRVTALDAYIESRNAGAVIHPHYEIDQSDRPRLQSLIEQEFQGPLDLAVDDASHAYEPTRASFNALFPYLREGGFYVIEDWGWAHWDRWEHLPPDYQTSGALYPGQPAVTNLIVELVMAAATSPSLIPNVSVTFNMAIIEKGSQQIDPKTFDIANYHVARDHKWHPIL